MSEQKQVAVVTWVSKPQGLLPIYQQQLQAAGIPLIVKPGGSWAASMEDTLKNYQQAVTELADYERLIFSDGFDVLFYGTAEELREKLSDEVVIAAEKNCFPDPYLASKMPDTKTPWRYVNFGLVSGSPRKILDWCNKLEKWLNFGGRNMINQQFFNHLRSMNSPMVTLDSDAKVFYCMQKEAGELGFRPYENGEVRPYNLFSKCFPNFIHFNGNWPKEPFLLAQEFCRLKHAEQLTAKPVMREIHEEAAVVG